MLEGRARARGLALEVVGIGLGDPTQSGLDLFYVGGEQDHEQELVSSEFAARGESLRDAVAGGAAVLAVCGGYQLLGRFYRDRGGTELPGAGLLPLHTVAGDRRMIGDVLLECGWAGQTLAGFENHAGRTFLDEDAEPLGRVISGFGNDGESGLEGCRAGRVYGTYLHGPLLPRNAWLADHLLEEALAHHAPRDGGRSARAARRRARAVRVRGRGRAGTGAWRPLLDELLRGGVPAPVVIGRQMSSADPAIQAEQIDPVGLTTENLLAERGQHHPRLHEPGPISEGRRLGQLLSVSRLHEPGGAAAERPQRAEQPRVTDERRLLQLLCREEHLARRARARRDGLERLPLRAREPGGGRR